LPWTDNVEVADGNMNPILLPYSNAIGSTKNENIPKDIIPGWGEGMKRAEFWRANDGIVSTISQKYPWINENKDHPVGGNIVAKNEFSSGKWYYNSIRELVGGKHDHLDAMMFPNSELFSGDAKRIKNFWKELYQRLASLE